MVESGGKVQRRGGGRAERESQIIYIDDGTSGTTCRPILEIFLHLNASKTD